ncbi:MAG: sensor histidine kinase [Nesterenkonia sp.]
MTDSSPAPHEPQWDDLGLVRRRGVRGWFRRHPGWMNAVVVVIYLLLALWGYPTAAADMGGAALMLLVGYGVIAVGLLLRHLRPFTVLVLVMLFEAAMLLYYPWQGAQMLGLCFAAYAMAYHYGLRLGLLTSVPASILGYAGLLRADAWSDEYGVSLWMRVLFNNAGLNQMQWLGIIAVIMVFSVGISAGIGAAVRRGHRHEREILDWARSSRQLAQVGERNRIAREMHDVVAHSVSVMISLADGARVVVRKDAERADEVLGELSSTGRGALADMRRVIGVLNKGEDVAEARSPVHESLEELYAGFRHAGLPLTVTHTGPALSEDPGFGLTVHRIIQESLTNVLRYGRQVTRVEVAVEHHLATEEQERERLSEQGFSHREQEALGLAGAAQVLITITDDGLTPADGSPTESVGSQLGIKGMQERAGFYSGSVYAGPTKHRGWAVRAVLEPPESTSVSRSDDDAARTPRARTAHQGSQATGSQTAGSQATGPQTAEDR